ncbi:MAG TPA: inorganic phosphate transporter [Solirubrobacterales bacterium]|nr:inorganic phosphate transporter [Solirubrobacterales bacterium]
MVLVVVVALGFGFSNGFHDTFDVISTAVSTGAATPQVAIAVAALLNFAGALVSVAVAATVAHEVVKAVAITPAVVFAGLVGAIAWNLATWRFSLPSSSSHALIGGVVGATLVAAGTGAVHGSGLVDKVLLPALVAPLAAFGLAGVLIVGLYRLFGRRRPGPVTRGFRRAQIASGGLLALAHGANDGQKTMGVIMLALIANGTLGAGAGPPLWAIIAAAAAIALGTYSGGWRVLRSTGARIIKMDAAQGFAAQSAGAAAILVSTFLGFPISTTHAISGGVVGAGAVKRVSAVRWGVAGNIMAAWLLTLPAAAAIGAAAYGIARIFGTGALGPLLVALIALALIGLAFPRRSQREPQVAHALDG